MLKKEQLEFLSEQLHQYKYNYDEILKANAVLSDTLEELKEVFKDNGNVVAYHDSRIKTPNSYLNKLLKDYDSGKKNTFDNIHDIVATRLVCLNLYDIEEFVKLLRESDKINIVEERDYIFHPKKSGYRSYHIIIEVPFIDDDGIEHNVKAEIQLRTILMDVFAREEHKLRYKNNGEISVEDKKRLKELSEELYFFDLSLDKMARPVKNFSKENLEELKHVKIEFDNASDLFKKMHSDLDSMIKDFTNQYDKKDDILHIISRVKPISSINRKLTKKNLKCTTENILYNLKDVLGYKIVCTDYDTAKDFINYFNEKIGSSNLVKISEVSDHLDEPKESGYRGYKINLDYCPPYMLSKPITTEILIRTMVQDAWALQQHARVYNKEESYKNVAEYVETGRGLKGLSYPLHRVEMALNDLKEKNIENKIPQQNLVKEVKEFENVRKLSLVKKGEE